MSKNILRWWLFFSGFLALLQFWTALVWLVGSTGTFPLSKILQEGVLIFWACALSVRVAEDYGLFLLTRGDRRMRVLADDSLLIVRGIAFPGIVLWLAVVTYILALDSQALTTSVVVFETALVCFSCYHSLMHFSAVHQAVRGSASVAPEGEE